MYLPETCAAHLDYPLDLQHLTSKIRWCISPRAILYSVYKGWFPGKLRQKSVVSSEGRLKVKCLILPREFSAVVQTQGMELKSSAICEKNLHYHILVPPLGRCLYNFSFLVDAFPFCICQKKKSPNYF